MIMKQQTKRSPSGTRTVQQATLAQNLAQMPRIRKVPVNSFGAAPASNGYSSSRTAMPQAFTYVLDNSGGAGVLRYVMGDPNGAVAAALGATYTQPTSAFGTTVAALQASFISRRVAIVAINYAATSGPTQFGSTFQYVQADVDGQFGGQPINLNQFIRNDANNPNLQTLQFDSAYDLYDLSAFALDVEAGQIATITLMVGGTSN